MMERQKGSKRKRSEKDSVTQIESTPNLDWAFRWPEYQTDQLLGISIKEVIYWALSRDQLAGHRFSVSLPSCEKCRHVRNVAM